MEYLVSFVVWSLVVYGCTNIFVNAKIMSPFREWAQFSSVTKRNGEVTKATEREFQFFGKLVTCILCMGFWVGGFWGVYWDPFVGVDSNPVMHFLFNGFLGSAVTWLIHLKTIPLMKGQ
tara:strand:- start:20728 stop:21084 length:357 start_codon:yes stop_codon:yes gene_type:complete